MNVQFTTNKLIELFIEIDDLLHAYHQYQVKNNLLPKQKVRATALAPSEIATIIVMYNLSGYKTFEYYYKDKILKHYKGYFPKAPSYECFLSYITKSLDVLLLWLLFSMLKSKATGLYFIDAKRLEVCHIKRAHSNKVFKGIARKGKSSMGWFYGLKLHLVINNLGEIMSFDLTSGNVADNNHDLLKRLLDKLQGICVGDKGYLSKLFDTFYEQGLHLLTKPKKNMKPLPISNKNNKLIDKRGVVESVFDILKHVCDIEHSRHRKPTNAFSHILASLIAYQYMNKKPRVFFPSVTKRVRIAA